MEGTRIKQIGRIMAVLLYYGLPFIVNAKMKTTGILKDCIWSLATTQVPTKSLDTVPI